jgi:hypothetical protein
MTTKEHEKLEAIKDLRTWIKPSGKINIFITSVSRSGMSRRMKVYSKDMGAHLTYLVAKACDLSENDNGVSVGGCGMDMAFWLADRITYALGYRNRKTLRGNGGSCIDWKAIA